MPPYVHARVRVRPNLLSSLCFRNFTVDESSLGTCISKWRHMVNCNEHRTVAVVIRYSFRVVREYVGLSLPKGGNISSVWSVLSIGPTP